MKDVCVRIDQKNNYQVQFPYSGCSNFSEIVDFFGGEFVSDSSTNAVYDNFRKLLIDMGLDKNHVGTQEWNPFADFIKKGERVVIKPNLVLHHNRMADDIDAVVTNAVLLRPIIDYALKALDGTGELIVADAPHGDADFESVVRQNGLRKLIDWYHEKGYPVDLRDLRKYYYPHGFSNSIMTEREGDVDDYVLVQLKSNESYLDGLSHLERLYGSDYDRSFIVEQHKNNVHKYLISGTVLKADVIISVPKLKTHKKTGVTINLKNLVGINGNKNYLAHYRVGTPRQGGDEYPDTKNVLLRIHYAIERFSKDHLLARNTRWGRIVYGVFLRYPSASLLVLYKRLFHKYPPVMGNWYGNDTCWRMCLDLNYILRFSDKEGQVHNTPQRKYFCVVDGIVGGEEDGPMDPTPKFTGLLAIGNNPYYTDYVCVHAMGFDPEKMKLYSESFTKKNLKDMNYDTMDVSVNIDDLPIPYKEVNLHFKAQAGWKGHIEK